ncbi:MAG TPA: hypothetical protein PLO24_04405 [Bacteroidales bacterium]|jgi:hypothetical protein|nr:hypothetical protein [Bacteroidales bacterium]HOS71074.1 hypothetical protein [Bacteroidales bacterium]HQH25102.1 hypothetical protein [Bacteroidales bacterium]HQJ83583.1 hypothetical protein [Bacteroidales bacterium]
MDTSKNQSSKNPGTTPVQIIAVLITYLIAGFITVCICGIGYLLIK